MKKTLLILFIGITSIAIFSCRSTPKEDDFTTSEETTETETPVATTETASYDATKGEGNFTNVEIGATLDAAMAASGEKIYTAKCAACHKLTDEKLVGPGWKGLISRHTPEWIMNFITNTDVMLDKDPKAIKQLEECQVRMPNQGLTDDEARHIFEFARKNDGVK